MRDKKLYYTNLSTKDGKRVVGVLLLEDGSCDIRFRRPKLAKNRKIVTRRSTKEYTYTDFRLSKDAAEMLFLLLGKSLGKFELPKPIGKE